MFGDYDLSLNQPLKYVSTLPSCLALTSYAGLLTSLPSLVWNPAFDLPLASPAPAVILRHAFDVSRLRIKF